MKNISAMAKVMRDQIEEYPEEFSFYNKNNNCSHKCKYKTISMINSLLNLNSM